MANLNILADCIQSTLFHSPLRACIWSNSSLAGQIYFWHSVVTWNQVCYFHLKMWKTTSGILRYVNCMFANSKPQFVINVCFFQMKGFLYLWMRCIEIWPQTWCAVWLCVFDFSIQPAACQEQLCCCNWSSPFFFFFCSCEIPPQYFVQGQYSRLFLVKTFQIKKKKH